jgi:16S rRNA processing protein RimM
MAAPAGKPEPATDRLIRIAEILGAHGLRGEVRLRSFASDPSSIKAYSPLSDAAGGRFTVSALRQAGATADLFIARLSGIERREAAERLAGTPLYVDRERLLSGLADGEFLHADLIGCEVETRAGKAVGKVIAVQNFGAGDLIEIAFAGSRRTEFLPFAESFVTSVDLEKRRVIVAVDPMTSE